MKVGTKVKVGTILTYACEGNTNVYSNMSNMSPSCSSMSTTVPSPLCTTKLLYGCQLLFVRLCLLLLTLKVSSGLPGAPSEHVLTSGALGGVHVFTMELASGAGLHVGCRNRATLSRVGVSTCCRYCSQSGHLQSGTFTISTVGGVCRCGGHLLTAQA